MTRHDANRVQAMYIAAVIQAARKVAANIEASGGLHRAKLVAYQEDLEDLVKKTQRLSTFERQSREQLTCTSDSAELADVLAKAAGLLNQTPEEAKALSLSEDELQDVFSLGGDDV